MLTAKRMTLGVLALGASATALAAVPVGTQGFADIGIPLADGSTNGNISTSTMFTIGDLTSTLADSGVFAGMPPQNFGSVTFDITKPGSLSFSDGPFGAFVSTHIDPTATGSSITFFVTGDWTPGTLTGGGSGKSGPFLSDLTISFTQTPATSGTLSDSATFSTPSGVGTPVPEPGPLVLMGLGLAGLALSRRRRK